MSPGKLILIFIMLFSTVDCLSQTNTGLIGEWAGRLKDSSGEFEYKLKLEREESGVYTGVSTSLSANFYCESKDLNQTATIQFKKDFINLSFLCFRSENKALIPRLSFLFNSVFFD